MKTCAVFIALLTLLGTCALAQETNSAGPVKIQAREAKDHLNSQAIVTGKVVEVNKAEKLVRLNLEKPFPKQALTLVIFANRTNLFPHVDELQDKTVEARGRITEYRGRPEIIITSTNQVRVLESATETGESDKK